jgi:hypothetical protein
MSLEKKKKKEYERGCFAAGSVTTATWTPATIRRWSLIKKERRPSGTVHQPWKD